MAWSPSALDGWQHGVASVTHLYGSNLRGAGWAWSKAGDYIPTAILKWVLAEGVLSEPFLPVSDQGHKAMIRHLKAGKSENRLAEVALSFIPVPIQS